MCPCNLGRLGAATVTACMYCAWVMGGLSVMLAGLHDANIIAIGWAAATVFGVGWLLIGIFEALGHEDAFVLPSFLWSVAAIGLAGYAIEHGWYLTKPILDWGCAHCGVDAVFFHMSRAFWMSLIASEAFNIWLNLRGIGRRRYVPPMPAMPERTPEPKTTRLRRRRRIEWVEDIEGRGIGAEELAQHLGSMVGSTARANVLPAVGQSPAVPQVLYAKDENGNFIPVQLPPDSAVPVIRRLR
jgi:hypothetical protein